MNKVSSTIPYDLLEQFLAIPGEQILLAKRMHFITALIPLCIIGIFFMVSSLVVGFLFLLATPQPILFVIILSYLLILALTAGVHGIVSWYFHLYLVTTRRIVEVHYKPFVAQIVNDVLLDQVRCTEVDVQVNGYLYSLLDIGDIIITFDRPTHQQEYVLSNVHKPRHIANMLGQILNTPKADINSSFYWHKTGSRSGPSLTFTEEIMPKQQQQMQFN